ncbi:MAG: hypothetical protein C5B49_14975 [Bdellovibrio sp.]|nr:MAG: hypothetical protein C5B49_14975 [Bdellovibrio sp.]
MMSHLAFVENFFLAVLLGSVIGVERQWRQRHAGLRTNSLVAAGSGLFVLLSQMIPTGTDQSRIASYVVSGVGFLGAGVIMRDGTSVRGLNTAATLWCSAAVGCLAGYGLHLEAAIGALTVVTMNICLRPLAKVINRQNNTSIEQDFYYRVTVVCKEESENPIRYLLLQAVSATTLVLQNLKSVDLNNGSHTVEVSADVESPTNQNQLLEQIVSRLGLEKGVSSVAWKAKNLSEDGA